MASLEFRLIMLSGFPGENEITSLEVIVIMIEMEMLYYGILNHYNVDVALSRSAVKSVFSASGIQCHS